MLVGIKKEFEKRAAHSFCYFLLKGDFRLKWSFLVILLFLNYNNKKREVLEKQKTIGREHFHSFDMISCQRERNFFLKSEFDSVSVKHRLMVFPRGPILTCPRHLFGNTV